ncbi:hypothetical protein MTR_4g075095 [Medicago truncatula]|uniref:Uncharacterized protein n=1 Tax=Medicago truncatula TaxID=3880 RepID=A0A072UMG0_MEDTR|nr:hypothetical protein MTR_4g075095 [Medicago truncatula]
MHEVIDVSNTYLTLDTYLTCCDQKIDVFIHHMIKSLIHDQRQVCNNIQLSAIDKKTFQNLGKFRYCSKSVRVQFDIQHPNYEIGCCSSNLTTMMQHIKGDKD